MLESIQPSPGALYAVEDQMGPPPVPTPSTSSTSNLQSTDLTPSDGDAMLEAVDKLKFFLATAPGSFEQATASDHSEPLSQEERCFNRFVLPTGELVSCVLWNGLYHISKRLDLS